MKMFATRSLEYIEERIEHLEDVITAGAQSTGEASTGQTQFLKKRENMETLRQLYARWEEKTGRKIQPERWAMTVLGVQVSRYS